MYRVVKLWSLVNTLAKNPYFFPTPQILKPLFLPFFYFRKIRSRHHRDHFHLPFCWVLSIGWGEMIFCKKVGKRGVKTWNIFDVEWSEEFLREIFRFLPCKFFWINAYFISFWKNREAAYFPPPPIPTRGEGALLARIFTDGCGWKIRFAIKSQERQFFQVWDSEMRIENFNIFFTDEIRGRYLMV